MASDDDGVPSASACPCHEVAEVGEGVECHSGYEAGFVAAFFGEAGACDSRALGGEKCGEDSSDGADASVEGEFTQDDASGAGCGCDPVVGQ